MVHSVKYVIQNHEGKNYDPHADVGIRLDVNLCLERLLSLFPLVVCTPMGDGKSRLVVPLDIDFEK